jgi:hypothetical protein
MEMAINEKLKPTITEVLRACAGLCKSVENRITQKLDVLRADLTREIHAGEKRVSEFPTIYEYDERKMSSPSSRASSTPALLSQESPKDDASKLVHRIARRAIQLVKEDDMIKFMAEEQVRLREAIAQMQIGGPVFPDMCKTPNFNELEQEDTLLMSNLSNCASDLEERCLALLGHCDKPGTSAGSSGETSFEAQEQPSLPVPDWTQDVKALRSRLENIFFESTEATSNAGGSGRARSPGGASNSSSCAGIKALPTVQEEGQSAEVPVRKPKEEPETSHPGALG